jgi:hypothetical protein
MVVCLGAMAQGGGAVRGVVTDQSGALVPGAQVTVTGPGGVARSAVSGNDGSYSVNGLAPGKYTVKTSAPGLTQVGSDSVDISGATVSLDITLRLVLEKQEITVEEQGTGQVSTDSSQNASSVVVTGDALDALSDDPDDLAADLAALAGPTAGPTGAQIYIDGFSAGDAVLPAKSSIREIRVNQNPFAPEFDQIGFGRTEILTKPGTDRFRGSVSVNYGSDTFNSSNPYAQEKPPFNLQEYSGNLGGSLNKRASYFLDVDYRKIDNGSVIHAVTLDPVTLAIVNPFTEVFTSPINRERISPRLDYQLNQANTLTFRYGFTRTETDNGGVGGFNLESRATNTVLTEHAYQVVETAVLGPHVVDETRFQLLRQHNQQDGVTPGVAVNVAGAFSGGGATNPDNGFIHHHYELQNYVMIAKGSHAIKGGMRLRAVQVYDHTTQNFNGLFTFGGDYAPVLNAADQPVAPGIVCNAAVPNPNCQTISSIEQYRRTLVFYKAGLTGPQVTLLGGNATQYTQAAGVPEAMVGQVDVGLFLGDDWRVRPNFTFTYGVRYETQTNIADHADFSPRLGFAWAPGNKGKSRAKTVIRAGFGIFYTRNNEQNTLLAERFNGVNQIQYTVVNPNFFTQIPPVLPAATSTRRIISSDLRTPYYLQSAISLERQLPHNTTVAATYTISDGLHEFMTRNINAPIPESYTGIAATAAYPYGLSAGPIYELESAGVYRQQFLVINVNSRVNRKVSLFGFYMINRAKSNTDGVGTFPANQYSLAGEYGPASADYHNRANIGGTVTSFWNLRFSPLISMQTGSPFDITTSQDIYGSTVATARPSFAASPNQPGVVATSYGYLNPNPLPGETVLTRNYGRGPGLFAVDLRVAKTFVLNRERAKNAGAQPAEGGRSNGPNVETGPAQRRGVGGFGDDLGTPGGGGAGARNYNLTLSISGRNITNHVNPGPIVGNINSSLFGQSNQIASSGGAFGGSSNNRRIEFQVRLAF